MATNFFFSLLTTINGVFSLILSVLPIEAIAKTIWFGSMSAYLLVRIIYQILFPQGAYVPIPSIKFIALFLYIVVFAGFSLSFINLLF
ncbi:MAG: hypothetical protein JEY91_02275 [Spirochaetaceae bacterium]|nr:hypothetical protein [Spirochaetaceae bacterium]